MSKVFMVMVMMMMNRLGPIPTIVPIIISAMMLMVIIVTTVFMVVMVPVFAAIAFPIIRQGCTSSEKDHKSEDYEHFYNIGLHDVLPFGLNLSLFGRSLPKGGLHSANLDQKTILKEFSGFHSI
jgi:hypothetical protein